MHDPYDVLGLTIDADETQIRQRYLELVRSNPPDREPERFAAVHAAYESLRDPAERIRNQLFTIDDQERFDRGDRDGRAPEDARRPAAAGNLAWPRGCAMNDRDDVEAILDKFRDWLEAARLEADESSPSVAEAGYGSGGQSAAPADDFGIINLVEEFTALRHEVKLQTKNGRGLVEQTETVLAALKAGDRAVPLGRAQGGPGRLDGGQGARRGARRPGRGHRSRLPRDRARTPTDRRAVGARAGSRPG